MIDLSSDTATRPTEAMRQAMATAPVGDDQNQEDPTVNALQDHVAELTGKEAALFLPSGTMCNAIAFTVHCRRGDAAILDRHAHPATAEAGGPAVLANVLLNVIDAPRGIFTADDVVPRWSRPAARTPLEPASSRSRTRPTWAVAPSGHWRIWPGSGRSRTSMG